MTRTRTCLLLAAATLALFAFANVRAPLQNEDSVLYVVLAEHIAAQGLASGFELFDRPFYSALVAALHGLTGISALAAARVLNAACAVLLVCAFAEFCRLLHRDDRLLPWAGLLLLAHPKLVNCFALLVRDLGYWALLMLSFCALMRHAGDGMLRWLALWGGCILGAAVFKPEAIAWGLLVPPGLLLLPGRALSCRARAAVTALGCVAVPAALAALALAWRLDAAGAAVPDPMGVPREVATAVIEGFGDAVTRYADTVLDPFSRHVAGISLAAGLLVILVAKLLNALGPLQLLALLAGHAGVPRPQRAEGLVFALLLVPALLLPAVFVAFRQFLDTRYVMLPMLLALALVVPCVRALCHRLRQRLSGRAAPALAAVVLVFGADLWFGLDRPKPYMLACVAWMRAELDPSARVFSNDVQLAAASGARWDWNEAHHAEARLASGWRPTGAAFWIIHQRDDRAALPELQAGTAGPLHEIRRFESGEGDRILVLRAGGAPAP